MESYDLIVVGAGGTGTYFLKEAARYISSNKSIAQRFKSFTIVDGDIVEEKNLARQCFQTDDIGRNKAEVMSEVLNEVFEMHTTYVPEYLISVSQLTECFHPNKIPFVVCCVDNHAARLVLEEFFRLNTNCILFDSANEYEAGECVYAYKFDDRVLSPVRSHYFPDILSGDLRSVNEMSCEELNSAAPQHIFTNMAAGMALLSGLSSLIEGNPLTGMVMFNPHKLTMEHFPYRPTSKEEKYDKRKCA